MTNIIFKFAKRVANDQAGATAIEYGMIAALIAVVIVAVVIVAGVTLLGTDVGNTFNSAGNGFSN